MNNPPSPIEREALELASRKCVGAYTLDHIVAWRSLTERGLTINVVEPTGAWYELTDAGRAALGNIPGKYPDPQPASPLKTSFGSLLHAAILAVYTTATSALAIKARLDGERVVSVILAILAIASFLLAILYCVMAVLERIDELESRLFSALAASPPARDPAPSSPRSSDTLAGTPGTAARGGRA